MQKPQLIINADGFGLTAGTEQRDRGVRSLRHREKRECQRQFPSRGRGDAARKKIPLAQHRMPPQSRCGKPCAYQKKGASLLNEKGEFWYREFDWKLLSGRIDPEELKAELFAQIHKCRELAGSNFTHVDCHMAKHRLPRFYPLFLDACLYSRVGRARVHRYYLIGGRHGRLITGLRYYMRHPHRLGVRAWNFRLRHKARKAGLSMADWSLALTDAGSAITLPVWISLLAQIPPGSVNSSYTPVMKTTSCGAVSRYVSQRDSERGS